MLNYIWLALIVIGITVAVWTDLQDLSTNKYHNDQEFPLLATFSQTPAMPLEKNRQYSCTVVVPGAQGVTHRAGLIPSNDSTGVLQLMLDEKSPTEWKEIYKAQRTTDFLLAHARWTLQSNNQLLLSVKFDPVRFVRLNSVTNDGVIKYAKTAVELAIGLIGIMALWLGLMKIAEQSGLVSRLAGLLRPITTRLFPDVPADHPAMGAMIMNISANMLGLMNAATPLGLKAMEELNKLNKKMGTATDAMCTFLVINTSNVQLIPATVIAIRAAVGSANPTEILGPVLVATFITLILGIVIVKLLARLPLYRKQLEPQE